MQPNIFIERFALYKCKLLLLLLPTLICNICKWVSHKIFLWIIFFAIYFSSKTDPGHISGLSTLAFKWMWGWGSDLVLIQTSFAFLWKLALKNTSWHKNNLIHIIKQEGLYPNKVNYSLASFYNCKIAHS